MVRLADTTTLEVRSATLWITLSAGYLAAFGVASMLSYGAKEPGDILASIAHPGAAYSAKFGIYELQTATGERNSVIQILTILAVLSTPLVPMTIIYWRRLGLGTKLIAGLGVVCYAAFFLFIGTLKGLGDLLVYGLAGILVSALGTWHPLRGFGNNKVRAVFAGILLIGFVGYMANNQSQRMVVFGIAGKYEPTPVVAALVGDSLGRGLSAVGSYPTQGYLGLAYNLDTPFEWTRGLGSSRAVGSYWDQYIGSSGTSELTYPARTELRTGWPAGMYWATIYPWLASDLTFPGAAIFMGAVGWMFAKFWHQGAFRRSRLSLLLFCQLALLLIYVPANNQIGIGRPSMIAFLSLVAIYLFKRPGRASKSL